MRSSVETAVDKEADLEVFFDRSFDILWTATLRQRAVETNASRSLPVARTEQKAPRWTFLGSGMTHPNFLATLQSLSPAARARVEAIAPPFC